MYSNDGLHASWIDSKDIGHDVYDYNSSSDSDSEWELRDLEELLYSHVHYEPNYLCTTGTAEDPCSSVIQVEQLSEGVLDRVDSSSASNSAGNAAVTVDTQVTQDEVAQTIEAASNQFSDPLKRKASSSIASQSNDKTRTKSKKFDGTGSIVLESASENSTALVNLVDNAASEAILDIGKQVTGQRVAKKKLGSRHKGRISCTAAAVAAAAAVDIERPVVVDSSSDLSSDAYCCDFSSSEELSSDGADDIKLSNINVDVSLTSDTDALADVLNSLSGMIFCSIS